jgi:hypothetical protein
VRFEDSVTTYDRFFWIVVKSSLGHHTDLVLARVVRGYDAEIVETKEPQGVMLYSLEIYYSIMMPCLLSTR